MKSEEVVVKGERPKSEEEADRSDGLSGGTRTTQLCIHVAEFNFRIRLI
jgi:hypothetical protein